METIMLWLCLQGTCIQVRSEAVAIAACESGDTVNRGTGKWSATNVNTNGTIDTGAWQFNSYWVWSHEKRWAVDVVAAQFGMTSNEFLSLYPTANDAPPEVQYAMFEFVYNNGKGAFNWNASRSCWKELLYDEPSNKH